MTYDGTQGDKTLVHESLRYLAWSLLENNDTSKGEAQLRRAISTAYYAVFHLVIYEVCQFMFGNGRARDKALRDYTSRTFAHEELVALCHSVHSSTMATNVRVRLFWCNGAPQGLQRVGLA